jgi:capsular polysaccharide transport system permease protein
LSDAVARPVDWGRALRVQLRVLGALILREMSTRFGRENLGYLWLFAEPLMLGTAIGALHHVTGHGLPGGLHVLMFWVTGYVPFYMFRSVINRAPTTVVANQSLLYHRRITILDIMLARNLLEGGAVMGTLVIFLAAFGMALDLWPKEPALVVFGMAAMLAMAHGAALILAAGAIYTDLIDRVIHLVTYVTMPFTGAFFMVFWLPTEMQHQALRIPTVQCFEMIRRGLFGTAVPTTFDVPYIITWIIGLNLAGLLMMNVARRKLVV